MGWTIPHGRYLSLSLSPKHTNTHRNKGKGRERRRERDMLSERSEKAGKNGLDLALLELSSSLEK